MTNRFRQAGAAKHLAIIAAVAWLPVAIMLAVNRLPDEAAVRERSAKTELEREQTLNAFVTLKEIERHCNATVPGAASGAPPFPPEYAACLESKLYFNVLKQYTEERVASKAAQDAADGAAISAGRRNAILFGVAAWVVPVLAMFLIGIAFRRSRAGARVPDRSPTP